LRFLCVFCVFSVRFIKVYFVFKRPVMGMRKAALNRLWKTHTKNPRLKRIVTDCKTLNRDKNTNLSNVDDTTHFVYPVFSGASKRRMLKKTAVVTNDFGRPLRRSANGKRGKREPDQWQADVLSGEEELVAVGNGRERERIGKGRREGEVERKRERGMERNGEREHCKKRH
jgi:hypothetical protein